MNRLQILLFLSLSFAGCNKFHKVGIMSVKDSSQKHISTYKVSANSPTYRYFTASNGDLVSFEQKDNICIATVDKKLPSGLSKRVKLPVCFSKEFYLENFYYDNTYLQKDLIHIEKTSHGEDVVYVGKQGLPGGGNVVTCEGNKYEYRVSNGVLGFVREYHKCFQCDYRREGDTDFVIRSLRSHHCTKCGNCLVKYKCSYSCTRICKVCCGCSERIAAEKERERKRRESAEREALERRRREEIFSSSAYFSYTPSYNYCTPSSYSCDKESEKKSKEAVARQARMQAASSGSTNTALDFDVSSNTYSSSTSRVIRNQ